MTWNYPDDECCGRCGAYYPEESAVDRPDLDDNSKGSEEVDEFGRVISNRKKEDKKPPEWPPQFESNGTAFVFDTRSSMFYQAESDFFYDPKSKLYYGNKKGTYYRYDSTVEPPFEQVQNVDAQKGAATDLEAEPALAPLPKPGSAKADTGKKVISINLKTKSLKNKKNNKAKDPSIASGESDQVPARLPKQHAKDIDKWSDRQVEKRVEERQIQRTAKGEPLCPLCRRMFPTVEKLLYHEQVSKLHKENLAKQKEVETPSQQQNSYADRAKQRRDMYGPETTSVLPVVPLGNSKAAVYEKDPSPPPQANLSERNIGNQLLQKMGWKEGKSLGRQGRPDEESANADLMKCWDRIETLAANGSKRPTSSGGGVGSQR
jgi:hypothetical protein